jgi:hypothetical protein
VFILFSQKTTSQTAPLTTNPFADVSPTLTSTSTGNDLTTFIQNCFTSYIQAYEANQQNSNPGQFDQDAQSCFTPDFIQQWPAIITKSEGDPILLSQDYESSWLSNVFVAIASQTQTSALAIVNIGSGSETEQVLAQLTNTAAGWRIAAVTSPTESH